MKKRFEILNFSMNIKNVKQAKIKFSIIIFNVLVMKQAKKNSSQYKTKQRETNHQVT